MSPTPAAVEFIKPSLPAPERQLAYIATGAVAGAATLPIEILWSRFSPTDASMSAAGLSKHLPKPTIAATTIFRAGTRFWIFDITRSQLDRYAPSLPVAVTGGLSGAAGGFAEVCAESLISRRSAMPPLSALGTQPAKLFFCFGTYTYLSTTLSPLQLPPEPFPYCWAMGAVAGGLGSGIVASGMENVRDRALWATAVPKGALIIGTVIAVQVTSCAALLQRLKS